MRTAFLAIQAIVDGLHALSDLISAGEAITAEERRRVKNELDYLSHTIAELSRDEWKEVRGEE